MTKIDIFIYLSPKLNMIDNFCNQIPIHFRYKNMNVISILK